MERRDFLAAAGLGTLGTLGSLDTGLREIHADPYERPPDPGMQDPGLL